MLVMNVDKSRGNFWKESCRRLFFEEIPFSIANIVTVASTWDRSAKGPAVKLKQYRNLCNGMRGRPGVLLDLTCKLEYRRKVS